MENFNLFGVLAVILLFIFIVITYHLIKVFIKIYTATKSKD